MKRFDLTTRRGIGRRAVTLVETWVALACVTVLLLIVGAAGSRNRDYSHAGVCADHLREIGQGFEAYLAGSGGIYPPSYVFPINANGDYDILNQPSLPWYGYAHWSWMAFKDLEAPDEMFQCPAIPNGGHPRTSPGPNSWDWELGEQEDWNGQSVPNDQIVDKQAPRIAFVGNAAILPRNKFSTQLSDGPRYNVLVSQAAIAFPSTTILVTDFIENWKAIGLNSSVGSTILAKSYRPLNPFLNIGSGFNEYSSSPTTPGFIYGTFNNEPYHGLLSRIRDASNILDYVSGIPPINAVGRHHPGGYGFLEGGTNALFIDGSVRRTTPWHTVDERLWGDRYYSLSGDNSVINY